MDYVLQPVIAPPDSLADGNQAGLLALQPLATGANLIQKADRQFLCAFFIGSSPGRLPRGLTANRSVLLAAKRNTSGQVNILRKLLRYSQNM